MAWYSLGSSMDRVTITAVDPVDPPMVMRARRDLENAFRWSPHSKLIFDVRAHPRLDQRELGLFYVLHEELQKWHVDDARIYIVGAKVPRDIEKDAFFGTYLVFGAPEAP